MFTEARKMQLPEDVLKVSSEAVLVELETVPVNSKKKSKENCLCHQFFGL